MQSTYSSYSDRVATGAVIPVVYDLTEYPTHSGEVVFFRARHTVRVMRVLDETDPDFLTEEPKVLITLVRERLRSTHNMDTACLRDTEVLACIAVLQELAGDEGLFATLDRLKGLFVDYAALVGEMIMAEEGTRH